MKNPRTFTVSKEEEGERLLSFLRKHFKEEYSVKWIKRGIEGRLCQINGRAETFSTHPLRAGQKITFDTTQLPQFKAVKQELTSGVLFEDDDLLICDKPVGIASDSEDLKKILQKPPLHVVHRLDKGTSGALIFAKNEEMQQLIKILFKKRAIIKAYLAIVDGSVKEKHGVIDIPLGMIRRVQDQIFWGPVPLKRGGKEAFTEWYCLKSEEDASLLRCFPKTGRTHQIRIHLKSIGHPILGDDRYGKHYSCLYPAPRLLLHASYLSFTQPRTKEKIEIKTPLPVDFKAAMKALHLKA
jgi:23S rRNA pseudouridine955/2504/2580 synthase/23S rRNA pseudouridine1911/1915/1917 synthase